jgi:ELWxxDGT repeat protein
MKERIIKAWPFLLTIVLAVVACGILTARAAAPLVSFFSPVDGETFFASSSNLIINFNQNISAGAGNIIIRRLSDDSIFETIPAASTSLVSIFDMRVVINPSANLENDTFYYINISSNAFRNGSSEYYSGISNRTDWNIHSKDELFVVELLKDINLLGGSSLGYSDDVIATTGLIYFNPDNGINGKELWVTDGTEDGTRFIKDISPASDNYGPNNFLFHGSDLYFVAADDFGNDLLWVSDGTTDGTKVISGQCADPESSSCLVSQEAFILGDNVFFFSSEGSTSSLYMVSGDSAVLIKEGSGLSANGVVLGNVYVYSGYAINGDAEIWKTDGTSGGTVLVREIAAGEDDWENQSSLVGMGSYMYFMTDNDINGNELWRTDGTFAGTTMVRDIYPGSTSGVSYANITVLNGYLYFSARNNNTSGYELWRSDGTSGGTVIVKNINSTANQSSNPNGFSVVGGVVYFSADDGTSGSELWQTNGVATGTVLVADTCPGSCESSPSQPTLIDNVIYFLAKDASSTKRLWRKELLIPSVSQVTDQLSSPLVISNDSSSFLKKLDSSIVFDVVNSQYGSEPWILEGTSTTANLLKDINTSTVSSLGMGELFVSSDDKLFFSANDGVSGSELWVSDGTDSGTNLIDAVSGQNGLSPSGLTAFNGGVVFSADDGVSGNELWFSDGTLGGTFMIKNINSTGDSYPGDFFVYQGAVYFAADDGVNGRELWVSNGTSLGTSMVKDINPSGYSSPAYFREVNGKMIFVADDGASGVELWSSNGTGVGTAIVKNINPNGDGLENGLPRNVSLNGFLYFGANEGLGVGSVWKTDGTASGTVKVKNTDGSFSPRSFMLLSDSVTFFSCDDAWSSKELWRTDGTAMGTFAIASSTNFKAAKGNNGLGFFTEESPWRTDGTSGRNFFFE